MPAHPQHTHPHDAVTPDLAAELRARGMRMTAQRDRVLAAPHR